MLNGQSDKDWALLFIFYADVNINNMRYTKVCEDILHPFKQTFFLELQQHLNTQHNRTDYDKSVQRFMRL